MADLCRIQPLITIHWIRLMKKRLAYTLGILLLGASFTALADSPVETVANGCATELTDFCGEVTPGNGRALACLYAHGDKLSGQCEYALYDAAAQLEQFVGALSYLVHECADDVNTHCAVVKAGEGRLAQCLLDNKANLTPRCSAAIDRTGLTVK